MKPISKSKQIKLIKLQGSKATTLNFVERKKYCKLSCKISNYPLRIIIEALSSSEAQLRVD